MMALLVVAALAFYTHLRTIAEPTTIICPHCGDLVRLPRGTIQQCPNCKKLVAG